MPKYNFDNYIDRKGTSCLKWDFGMQRKGRDDLLPLWVADMDFSLPEEVVTDLEKRVKHGVFGYTDPDDDYKASVIGWFKQRHGIEVDSRSITVVPGVVYAISLAIKAFTDPGDAVIIQQPVYYPFREQIELNNRVMVDNPLVYRYGRYEIDFEDFEKKILENNVKLFILCSPHNPVGRVWDADEMQRLADICLKHNVFVFADEIHSDFVYRGHQHISWLSLDKKYHEKVLVGTSASKTFNIAGLQVANIITTNTEIQRAFRRENDASGYSQPNALGLVATRSVYDKGGQWLDELIEYLEGNLTYVRDFLKEKLPQIKLVEPEGTYLVWLDFSEITDDHKVLSDIVLNKAKLWLDPGIIFGRETALFERINIACPRIILQQALEQLYIAVTEYREKILEA